MQPRNQCRVCMLLSCMVFPLVLGFTHTVQSINWRQLSNIFGLHENKIKNVLSKMYFLKNRAPHWGLKVRGDQHLLAEQCWDPITLNVLWNFLDAIFCGHFKPSVKAEVKPLFIWINMSDHFTVTIAIWPAFIETLFYNVAGRVQLIVNVQQINGRKWICCHVMVWFFLALRAENRKILNIMSTVKVKCYFTSPKPRAKLDKNHKPATQELIFWPWLRCNSQNWVLQIYCLIVKHTLILPLRQFNKS